MKKLFLCAAVAVFGFTMNAQESGDIELGVGAGLNLSTFYGNDASDADVSSRTALQFGVTGEYYFNDRWGLKSGFIYDSKGTEFDGGGEVKANYLFIPVYANWHFGSNRNWYLNFGPHIDILMSAEDEDGTDVKEFLASTDFGLGVGIGYKFEVSENLNLYIEYQGAGGFSDVVDGGDVDFKNTRSAFNVGVLFNL
uniref:porin family protein n=1 Tax=Gelidibacter sp. TaxID=2018083 RepID=UPI00404B44C8